MKIRLHKNATTTPAQRAFIQNNPQFSVAWLAEKTGVSQTTVRRWRSRTTVYDRPHTPRHIETALTPAQEVGIILCRMATRAGLDDLHQMVDLFMSVKCSRASLNRCLQRYHISRIPLFQSHLPFDLRDYTGTYFFYNHFRLPALDPGGDPIHVDTVMDSTFRFLKVVFSTSVEEFLSQCIRGFPLKVLGVFHTDPVILTHGQKEQARREQTGQVAGFCLENGLKCHTIPDLYTPTVERLEQTCAQILSDGRESQWPLPWQRSSRVHQDLFMYNRELNLRALRQLSPFEALSRHYTHFPNSFNYNPSKMEENRRVKTLDPA